MTTGTPEASASCTDWQDVSETPVCTNTSSEANTSARSMPVRKPRNAVGALMDAAAAPSTVGEARCTHVREKSRSIYTILGRVPSPTVDSGQERLGNDRDPHVTSVIGLGDQRPSVP